MKKRIITVLMATVFINNVHAINNIAFLNNPSPQDVKQIGDFIEQETKKPFFSEVVLFAANINNINPTSLDPNTPVLYYNEYFTDILQNHMDIIRSLQQKGIKVQISYLGNHQYAGWSCNMNTSASAQLAQQIVNDVTKYNFDGVNIDDEYSNCDGNTNAFYDTLTNIVANPQFTGKKLTKALYADSQYFSGSTNIAPLLSEGYEMTYIGDVSLLSPYVVAGMSKQNLYLGIWNDPSHNPLDTVYKTTQAVITNGYNGIMVWAANDFDTISDASDYYTQIAQAEYGNSSQVIYKR
ncbi:MAG: Weakly similar to endo-beta-N-acetylglucosaminidase [Pseudomonadota bacterium]|jgi:hypothetical protein